MQDNDNLAKLKILRDLHIAYAETFSSDSGKKVLEDLKRVGFEYHPPFDPQSQHVTAFNCGLQGMLKHIQTMMKVPDEVKSDE